LARGPGRLAAALRVDCRFDGLDHCRKGPLWLGRCDHEPREIEAEHQDRHRAGCEPARAVLSSGQSVRQRSKIACVIRGRITVALLSS
jgi:hypothetical protein